MLVNVIYFPATHIVFKYSIPITYMYNKKKEICCGNIVQLLDQSKINWTNECKTLSTIILVSSNFKRPVGYTIMVKHFYKKTLFEFGILLLKTSSFSSSEIDQKRVSKFNSNNKTNNNSN